MEAVHQELAWKPANMNNLHLSVRPSLDPNLGYSADNVDVTATPKFGSFEAQIPIPRNANFKDYFIYIMHDGSSLGGGERFTVGDPRPPTVGLTVDAPYWVCLVFTLLILHCTLILECEEKD